MIPQFNVWLCTVSDVQQRQLLENSNADWTDAQIALMGFLIRQASQQIVTHLGQLPLPYLATRSFDYTPDSISRDRRTLFVDAPLLAVTTLTNGNGDSIGASSYTLAPNNRYPKDELSLTYSSQGYFTVPSSGNTKQIISLAGEWGYVPHYGRHWEDSGKDVPAGDLAAGALTMTLDDVSAFEIGDYLQIESETLFVSAIDSDTKILTLERGVLGTTAAAHSAGEDILIFRQLDDIRAAATEWAAYLYKTRDRLGESVQLFDRSTRVVNQLSPLVLMALAPHRRRRVTAL